MIEVAVADGPASGLVAWMVVYGAHINGLICQILGRKFPVVETWLTLC